MRLIDADNLMKEFAEFVKESNNSDFEDVPTWNDAVSLLGSAQTVEAIPIERLKSKIDAILDNYPDGNEETEILCKLLYEWEKENGE